MDLELVVPSLEEYSYEQKLLSDPDTMDYNAGYDVSYSGYHYDTGCIDFPKEKWLENFNRRQKENKYFAYIKDKNINEYVGYVNYHYDKNSDRYECGIVIEGKHRGKGYSKKGLQLLCEEAFNNGVLELYDNFEKSRTAALKVFSDVGFRIVEEVTWKKFGKDVDGVVVCIKKN